MARVYFRRNLIKDANNWYEACNTHSIYGVDWKKAIEPKLRAKIVGVEKSKALRFLKSYIVKTYEKDKELIIKRKRFKEYWYKNQKEIFLRLRKITKRPIWPLKIDCYYTSFPRCPYHVDLKRNKAYLLLHWYNASSVLHEIMHFQVHRYFWNYCREKGLDNNQIHHLKEAMVFLTNEEFSDLGLKDNGYQIHKNLQKDLKKEWRKHKSFKQVLDRGIFLIKSKYTWLS